MLVRIFPVMFIMLLFRVKWLYGHQQGCKELYGPKPYYVWSSGGTIVRGYGRQGVWSSGGMVIRGYGR